MDNIQDISCGKMFPAHSPQTKERISDACLKQSAKSKTKPSLFLDATSGCNQDISWVAISPLPGESLMRNTGESPNEENVSSLSQILEANVPIKYYLSQKACQGILRRASERGKELPAVLKAALMQQATMDITEN